MILCASSLFPHRSRCSWFIRQIWQRYSTVDPQYRTGTEYQGIHHVYDYFAQLKDYEAKIKSATTNKEKKKIEKEMQEKKDRNVAVYGMITLRTDGKRVVIAQKLEIPGGDDNKWDIHELHFNQNLEEFE